MKKILKRDCKTTTKKEQTGIIFQAWVFFFFFSFFLQRNYWLFVGRSSVVTGNPIHGVKLKTTLSRISYYAYLFMVTNAVIDSNAQSRIGRLVSQSFSNYKIINIPRTPDHCRPGSVNSIPIAKLEKRKISDISA